MSRRRFYVGGCEIRPLDIEKPVLGVAMYFEVIV